MQHVSYWQQWHRISGKITGVKVSGNAWERGSQALQFCSPAFQGSKEGLSQGNACPEPSNPTYLHSHVQKTNISHQNTTFWDFMVRTLKKQHPFCWTIGFALLLNAPNQRRMFNCLLFHGAQLQKWAHRLSKGGLWTLTVPAPSKLHFNPQR